MLPVVAIVVDDAEAVVGGLVVGQPLLAAAVVDGDWHVNVGAAVAVVVELVVDAAAEPVVGPAVDSIAADSCFAAVDLAALVVAVALVVVVVAAVAPPVVVADDVVAAVATTGAVGC